MATFRFRCALRVVALAVLLACASVPASASVVLDTTRVIFPSDRDEVSVRVSNRDAVPKLIQAWIDTGDAQARPEQIATPFQILTPIFRIEAGAGHVLRIRNAGLADSGLATDRETVYWLNVLELPPKPTGADAENYLQFSFRTRIKVFVRPPGMPGRALEAADRLRWEYRPGVARATNPTPFHVSLTRVDSDAGETGGPVMVAPLSSRIIPLAADPDHAKGDRAKSTPPSSTVVRFTSIDDYGAPRKYEKDTEPLQRAPDASEYVDAHTAPAGTG